MCMAWWWWGRGLGGVWILVRGLIVREGGVRGWVVGKRGGGVSSCLPSFLPSFD